MKEFFDDGITPKNATYWKRRCLKAETELETLDDKIKTELGENIKHFLRDLSKTMSAKCAVELSTYLLKAEVIKL